VTTRQLLIGTDGSDRATDALALGALLAPVLQAKPVLLHAHPDGELDSLLDGGHREREVRALAEATAAQAKRIFGRSQAPSLSLVADRSPAAALRAAAERDDVAAIVLGSSRRGPIGRVLPGGVAQRLLLGAPCPLVVAPAGFAARQPLSLGRIGCGFDASAEAWVALRAATDLARANRGPLVIIAVHQPTAFGHLALIGDRPPVSVNERLRDHLARQLEQAAAETALGSQAQASLRTGDPASVLASASAEVALLVVGSRARGPLGSVLAGSVATALLRTATCPVMVVPRRASAERGQARISSSMPPTRP
jgi:nucleotide-binding universal stress UspA family protein